MLVRETAARQLEERRADWGYSKPVVALDIVWNLAFVFASVMMLLWSRNEKPNVPIRVWIFVYAAQCLVHVVLVYVEFRRRRSGRRGEGDVEANYEDESQEEDEEERSGVLGVSSRSRYVCVISICLFCFGVWLNEFDLFRYAFMCVIIICYNLQVLMKLVI